MKEIRGDAKNIRSLLGGAKFGIDYYQREYRWETKQVAELIDDLAEKFLDSHDAHNERGAVEGYGHYFLGSIIISDKDGKKFIIDGQQRLTSLTLLLIHLYRRLDDQDQRSQVADLIFSQKFGKRSFNLDVAERTECMDALFTGEPFDDTDQPESVANILARFEDIGEVFPDELGGDALPFFTDWLMENVHLVEITAYSDSDAYTIFETMNDRGLSLTSTDMLKGYLLANITDTDRRNAASAVWRQRVAALQRLGKEEDADAVKAWLRSQHAQTIRERRKGAQPRDFDLVGTEFHRWVRDKEQDLGLNGSQAFGQFIQEDFSFYTRWYERLRLAAETLTPGLEAIHFNAQNSFTLQYPVLLAPLRRTDAEEEIYQKLRVVAAYLDIVIARRIWNWKATSYSAMQYNMFQLIILAIRGRTAAELVGILMERLEAEEETFASNDRFYLHGMNRPQVHRLLARMIDFIETSSGQASRYSEYVKRGKNGYEVEHIWANHPERHTDEFAHPTDFTEYRNRVGGLLLLPKSFNASYGDKPYADKRDHYFGQNLLAQSLHEKAYQNNPGFLRFLETSGLDFRPHPEFKKADLDARQELYRAIAEKIWNPDALRRELDHPVPVAPLPEEARGERNGRGGGYSGQSRKSIAKEAPASQVPTSSPRKRSPGGELPSVDWAAADFQALAGVLKNPAQIAVLDLCADRPGEWIGADEVRDRAGRSRTQFPGDMSGLTKVVRSHFGRSNSPVDHKWAKGGTNQQYFSLTPERAAMWHAARSAAEQPSRPQVVDPGDRGES